MKKIEKLITKKVQSVPNCTVNISNKKADEEIKVGDQVFIKDLLKKGRVLTIQGKQVSVSLNTIPYKTTLSKIRKVCDWEQDPLENLDEKKMEEKKNLTTKARPCTLYPLDLHGVEMTEVSLKVEKYIDKAMMHKVKQIRIIHGKGEGILRKTVRKIASQHEGVASYKDENAGLNGKNITIIHLK